jgi:hypothetical protein
MCVGFEWGLPAIRVSNSPTQLPPTRQRECKIGRMAMHGNCKPPPLEADFFDASDAGVENTSHEEVN